jgi:citrate lyase gamma subunit
LINRIKQNLDSQLSALVSRAESSNNSELAADISSKVEKQVKNAIQQELKKS